MDRVWWLPALVCVGLFVVAVLGVRVGVRRGGVGWRRAWPMCLGAAAGVLGVGVGVGLTWSAVVDERDRPGAWWWQVAVVGTRAQALRAMEVRWPGAGKRELQGLVAVGRWRGLRDEPGNGGWRRLLLRAADEGVIDQAVYAAGVDGPAFELRDLWLREGDTEAWGERAASRRVDWWEAFAPGAGSIEGEVLVADAAGRPAGGVLLDGHGTMPDWPSLARLPAGVYAVRVQGRELHGGWGGNAWLPVDVSGTLTVVASGEPLVELDTSGGPASPRPRAVSLWPQGDGSVRWYVHGSAWPDREVEAVFRVSVEGSGVGPIVLGAVPMGYTHGRVTGVTAARLLAELEDGGRVTVRFEPDAVAMRWATRGTVRASSAEFEDVPVEVHGGG